MPIPPLDTRGLLPEGIYEASISEIKERFSISAYRIALFDDFISFINNEIGNIDIPIFIGGSYLSDKPLPNDIEITIAISLDFLQIEPLLGKKLIELQSKHDWLKSHYRMDFYISFEIKGCNDFRQFFQYVGEKTANAKGISAKDKRGIIRVIL